MRISSTARISVTAALGLCLLCGVALGHGDKARVAVRTIESSTMDCSNSQADAVADMFKYALDNSGKFLLLDDPAAADVIISGKILEFDPEVKSGGVAGALKKKALGAAGAETRSAKIKWELTLSDARTGKKIKSMKIEGNSTDWSVDASNSYFSSEIGMAGELSEFSGESLEDAIRQLLSMSVEETLNNTPKDYFAYSGEERPAEAGEERSTDKTGYSETSPGGAVADDMKLYNKYDFVPGDKVIFYDDMSGDEEGEFPRRWNLEFGVFEVARLGKDLWIWASDEGYIRPKMPSAPLPERYTVELDFYDHGPEMIGNYFHIQWLDDEGTQIGEFGIVSSSETWLTINDREIANKLLPEKATKGAHTMRVMATANSMKCYIDEVRVANVPKVEGFNPVGFRLYLRPYADSDNVTLVRGFRFAEGGKSMRQQLDQEGRIVTHGILFDSGSYKIKGESYQTLKDIGALLTDDPALRLSIEGHTDSDGAEDYNMTLSKNRAESVMSYLMSEYGVAGDRLEAKGWGESKPIDVNTSPEGKANNRRVELVKL